MRPDSSYKRDPMTAQRMPAGLTEQLKNYAKQEGLSFSALVRDACTAYMTAKGIEVVA